MPIFLDPHLSTDMPPDHLRDFLKRARDGSPDPHGVQPLDLFCADDGRVYYVVAAADEAAVRHSHDEAGIVCRRVKRVHLFGSSSDALSEAHKKLIRHMIVGEQTLPASMGGLGRTDRWLRQVG